MRQKEKGFTLIEIMIAVAIVAILASVAVPSYTDYSRRSKISEATTALLGMRTRLEQFYQDQRTFAGACAAGTVAPLPAGLRYFVVTCPVLDPNRYVVQAAGINDMEGIVFTIDQANVRTTTVTPGSVMAAAGYVDNGGCWVQKKGGVC
jgi:type IV pilus assembly protein PilE